MLTGEREGGREKCARYWPTASNADSTLVFWDVSVRLVHIEHSRGDRDHDYDIREFAVTHTKVGSLEGHWRRQTVLLICLLF